MPVWLIWLIAALGLAGAEALTGDLFLLMLSGGALAAVGSNLIFDNYVIDGIVFMVVSLLLLVLVRPALKTALHRRRRATGPPERAGGQECDGARPRGTPRRSGEARR